MFQIDSLASNATALIWLTNYKSQIVLQIPAQLEHWEYQLLVCVR
jgi:hypothetical protein